MATNIYPYTSHSRSPSHIGFININEDIEFGDNAFADAAEDAARQAIIQSFNAAKSKGTQAARNWCREMGDYIAGEFGASFFESLCGNLADAAFSAAGEAIGIETNQQGRTISWRFQNIRYQTWDDFQRALEQARIRRELVQSQEPVSCEVPTVYLNHEQRVTLGKQRKKDYKEFLHNHPLWIASRGRIPNPDGSRTFRKLSQEDVAQINSEFNQANDNKYNFSNKDLILSKKYDFCSALNTLMGRSATTAITYGLHRKTLGAFQFPWEYLSTEELDQIFENRPSNVSGDEFDDWLQTDEFIVDNPKSRYYQAPIGVRLTHAAAIALGEIPANSKVPAAQALEQAGLTEAVNQVTTNTEQGIRNRTASGENKSKVWLFVGIGAVALAGGYFYMKRNNKL